MNTILKGICGVEITPLKNAPKKCNLKSGKLTHFEKDDITFHDINMQRIGIIETSLFWFHHITSDFSFYDLYETLNKNASPLWVTGVAIGTTEAMRMITMHRDCAVKERLGNIFLTFKDEMLPTKLKYQEENLVFGSLIKRDPRDKTNKEWGIRFYDIRKKHIYPFVAEHPRRFITGTLPCQWTF